MTDFATPNLPSRDFDKTVQFYGALGFEERFRDEGWMILARGGLQFDMGHDGRLLVGGRRRKRACGPAHRRDRASNRPRDGREGYHPIFNDWYLEPPANAVRPERPETVAIPPMEQDEWRKAAARPSKWGAWHR